MLQVRAPKVTDDRVTLALTWMTFNNLDTLQLQWVTQVNLQILKHNFRFLINYPVNLTLVGQQFNPKLVLFYF